MPSPAPPGWVVTLTSSAGLFSISASTMASSAAIVIIAITLGDNLIAAPARHIASLYGAEFDLVGLDRYGAGGLLLIGVTLTWLSARYAVDRELRRLEPR